MHPSALFFNCRLGLLVQAMLLFASPAELIGEASATPTNAKMYYVGKATQGDGAISAVTT